MKRTDQSTENDSVFWWSEKNNQEKYLQYSTLKEKGLLHFDAWASTFGETVTAIELAPEGYTLVGR